MHTKYIVIHDVEMDREYPIVFANGIVHADVGRRFHVLAAGFCQRAEADGKWICFGESESLRIKSRSEDANILNRYV